MPNALTLPPPDSGPRGARCATEGRHITRSAARLLGLTAGGTRWQVSPSLLRGWREVIAFDDSGAAMLGDFVVIRAADVTISMGNQFFVQVLLDGHDISVRSSDSGRTPAAKVLFGRIKSGEPARVSLPVGSRWHALHIAISDRAVESLWGMKPDELLEHLRASRVSDGYQSKTAFESDSFLPESKSGVLGRICNCTLPGPARSAFIWSRSLELMVDIVSGVLAEKARPTGAASRSRMTVLAARDIIHRELAQPHTIDSLAFRVGLSRRDFMNAFREQFGTTFHEYYMNVRMTRAADLLADGQIRISEIAEHVGYAQLSSFSRAFKAFHGISPCAFAGTPCRGGEEG